MSLFKKAFKGIDSAIKQGTARALNRALSSTKTKVTRVLREETGLPTDVVKSRLRGKSAKQNDLGVILGGAVKYDIAYTKFTPKEKAVRVRVPGRRKARVYQGVSVKVGKGARQLLPGAFFLPNTNVVIQRQGKAKLPTKQPKTDIFKTSLKAEQADASRHMRETFEKISTHEIEFALQKKFSSNK